MLEDNEEYICLINEEDNIPYGLHGKRFRLVGNRLVQKELSKMF